MKVLVLFAGVLALALTASVKVKHQKFVTETTDYAYMQKAVLQLFKNVYQPNYYPEIEKLGSTYNFEASSQYYTNPKYVVEFLENFKYGFLPKGQVFSIFYDQHQKEAIAFFRVLYSAIDFDTFYKTAAWGRMHLNEGLYMYALSVALTHRPDTWRLELPPIYEMYPFYFYNTKALQKAHQYFFKGDYTTSFKPTSQQVPYFYGKSQYPEQTYRQYGSFPYKKNNSYPYGQTPYQKFQYPEQYGQYQYHQGESYPKSYPMNYKSYPYKYGQFPYQKFQYPEQYEQYQYQQGEYYPESYPMNYKSYPYKYGQFPYQKFQYPEQYEQYQYQQGEYYPESYPMNYKSYPYKYGQFPYQKFQYPEQYEQYQYQQGESYPKSYPMNYKSYPYKYGQFPYQKFQYPEQYEQYQYQQGESYPKSYPMNYTSYPYKYGQFPYQKFQYPEQYEQYQYQEGESYPMNYKSYPYKYGQFPYQKFQYPEQYEQYHQGESYPKSYQKNYKSYPYKYGQFPYQKFQYPEQYEQYQYQEGESYPMNYKSYPYKYGQFPYQKFQYPEQYEQYQYHQGESYPKSYQKNYKSYPYKYGQFPYQKFQYPEQYEQYQYQQGESYPMNYKSYPYKYGQFPYQKFQYPEQYEQYQQGEFYPKSYPMNYKSYPYKYGQFPYQKFQYPEQYEQYQYQQGESYPMNYKSYPYKYGQFPYQKFQYPEQYEQYQYQQGKSYPKSYPWSYGQYSYDKFEYPQGKYPFYNNGQYPGQYQPYSYNKSQYFYEMNENFPYGKSPSFYGQTPYQYGKTQYPYGKSPYFYENNERSQYQYQQGQYQSYPWAQDSKWLDEQMMYKSKQQFNQQEREKAPEYFNKDNFEGFTIDYEYNSENPLFYFTEDVGMNAFYYYYHIYFPFWMTNEEILYKTEFRGEQYYYFYQQLLARYNLERLSNGLGEIPLVDWDGFVNYGFETQLAYPNGYSFPQRPDYAPITPRWEEGAQSYDNITLSVTNIKTYEHRILEAIDSGFVWTRKGKLVSIFEPHGFEVLGNLIQANPESPNARYYGNIQVLARFVLGYAKYPVDQYYIAPSVLEHFETSLRDPAFYQLYKRVIYYFQRYKQYLPKYTQDELYMSGVKIEDVSVDKLITYFDYFYSDISSFIHGNVEASQFKDTPVRVKQYRLNHQPFTYKMNVNSEKPYEAVIRVFLGPKYDQYGKPYSINQNRLNFVEFDRFTYSLVPGVNVIERNSRQSFFVPDRTSYRELWMQVFNVQTTPIYETTPKQILWAMPQRMLLPKGSKEGQTFQMYFIITPYHGTHESTTMKYATYTPTLFWDNTYDKFPYGYPFDRQIEEAYFFVPNSYFKDVVIFNEGFGEQY